MKFKNQANFSYTYAKSLTGGGFGFGCPVDIKLLDKHKPVKEGNEYVWRFSYRKTYYVIYTPLDNVAQGLLT